MLPIRKLFVVFKVRNDGSLKQGSGQARGEKESDSGYLLKSKSTGFTDRIVYSI